MRYLILLALLMCLPVRGEAWQVVCGEFGGLPCTGPFGLTSTTGTTSAHAQGLIMVVKITTTCAISSPKLNAIYLGSETGDATIRFAIYSDSGGEPNSRLWISSSNTTIPQYATVTSYSQQTSIESLPAGTYWVGAVVTSSILPHWAYTAGGSDTRFKTFQTDPWFPETWDTAGDAASSNNRHFYVTN